MTCVRRPIRPPPIGKSACHAAVLRTGAVREAASITQCANNETQLILAVHSFADTHSGRLPPANFYQLLNQKTGNAAEGSGFYAMQPNHEQVNLFNQYTQDIAKPGYLGTQFTALPIHVCPSDPTINAGIGSVAPNYATGNYALNLALFGYGGTFNTKGAYSPLKIGNIPDGTSNTIGIMEASGCFPGYPAVDPVPGTTESYMTWDWPTYPNMAEPGSTARPGELKGAATSVSWSR
jgi:hypothetical protein